MKPLILASTLLLLLSPPLAWADNPRLVIENGGHLGTIRRMVFTRDGRRLISAGDDKVIRIWNLKTGVIERTLRGQIGDGTYGAIYALAVSPDDKYVAVGGFMAEPLPADQTTDTLERRRRLGAIRVFDIQTGELTILLRGNVSVVNSLAFSPTDPNVLASAAYGGQVMVWKISERTSETIYRHSNSARDVSFSPDGQRIASAGDDGVLRLWDVKEKRAIKDQRATPEGDTPLTAAVFSPRNDFVATAGANGMVTLWDGRTGGFVRILGRQLGPINSLAFSSDNSLITGPAAGTTRWSYLLSSASDKVAKFHRHDAGSEEITTAFSPSSSSVAISTGDDFRIKVFNLQTQRLLRELGGKGRYVQSVAISEDGRSIGFGDTLDFKNNNNRGPLTQMFALTPESNSYGMSLRGTVNNASSFIRARDTFDRLSLKTKSDTEFGRAFLQVTSKDTGRLYEPIQRSSSSGRKHLAYTFSKDGKNIISGGENGVLLLYDTATGKPVYELKGHTGAITSVTVSNDNRTLISGSTDQTLKIWDIPAARTKSDTALMLTVFVSADDEWVAWTPHGYYTSSLNGDKYIGWHVNQGEDKAARFYGAVQFQKAFYRPDVVAEFLKSHEITAAVRIANSKRPDISAAEGVLNATAVSFTLPPVIKIETPTADEFITTTERLKIKATVTSERLPITNVKIYFNGELHSLLPVNGPKTDLSMTIRLKPGVNVISIVAFTKESWSEPMVRTITYRSAAYGKGPSPNRQNLSLDRTPDAPARAATKISAMTPVRFTEAATRTFLPQASIEITSPKDIPNHVVQDPTVRIEGLARSDSELITITIDQDGEKDEFRVGRSVNGEPNINTTVTLNDGLNVIAITASDENSTSETVTRRITYSPKVGPDKKNLIFLGIGVNNSQEATLTPLKYADKDVIATADLFKKQETLVFDKVSTIVIPDEKVSDPNRSAILDGFDLFEREVRSHSNTINVIYLSGHGNVDESGRYFFFSSEHKNPPKENYDVPWSSIIDRVDRLPGITILFVDSCRAGSSKPYWLTSLVSSLKSSQQLIVFIASDETGVAQESKDWAGGHGAFTAAVLLGLGGEADRFVKQNGEVTTEELKNYVRQKVSELTERQNADAHWVGNKVLDQLVLSKTGTP